MPPDFLNSREDAILVWMVLIFGFAVSKDPRGIGGSFLGVGRAVLAPKLLILFSSALAYSAALVFAASRLGIWHTGALKETIYWFIATGVILVSQAVAPEPRAPSLLRRVLRQVLTITVVVEVIANLYAFPLAVELPVTLVLVVFVMLQAYAPYDANVTPATRRFIDFVLTLIAISYLSYFVTTVVSDPTEFFSRATAEAVLVGPLLTVALVPLLYCFAWWSRREQRLLRARFNGGGST